MKTKDYKVYGFIEPAELRRFFKDVGYRIKLAETTQQHIDKYLATAFNVFKWFAPDENKLSDILRSLLEVNGSHGQGDLFLRKMFRKLDINFRNKDLTNVTVQREAPTYKIPKHERQIDILVDVNSGPLLAIENKVDSLEQKHQVKDYLEHLRKIARERAVKYAFIYLTPNGSRPESITTSMVKKYKQENKLHCWSYQKDVSEWLEDCRRDCEAERVRNFLSDFISYIESVLNRRSENKEEASTDEH